MTAREWAGPMMAAEPPGDWIGSALCRGKPAELFFPVGTPGRGHVIDHRAGLAVCAECPVLEDCRAYALACGPDLAGVWGGTTPTTRDAIRRRRRTRAAS